MITTATVLAEATASWAATGFAHGNLNCDNIRLDGAPIDLNIATFIDSYDPFYAPNILDESGIYSFGNQSSAVKWCALRMEDVINSGAPVSTIFDKAYSEAYYLEMRRRTDLQSVDDVNAFLSRLASSGANYGEVRGRVRCQT